MRRWAQEQPYDRDTLPMHVPGGFSDARLLTLGDNRLLECTSTTGERVLLRQFGREAEEDDNHRNQFLDNLSCYAGLDHPMFPALLLVSESPMYAVFAWRGGVSLADVLHEWGRLPVGLALTVGVKLCEGLAYLHAANSGGRALVHRRVQPAHVRLHDGERVTLVGYEEGLGYDPPGCKGPGALMNRDYRYKSWEQLSRKRVDQRADVYQVGVTLYEALSGQELFHGDNDVHLYERVGKGRFAPLGDVAPDVPKGVAAVVERALAQAADDRFPDAASLGAALAEQLAEHLGAVGSDDVSEQWQRCVDGSVVSHTWRAD